MKVIMLEGLDTSGKSTLINRLKTEYFKDDFVIHHHFDKPKGFSVDERYGYYHGQYDLLFSMLTKFDSSNTVFIFDRCHISEYVYGPLWRHKEPEYLPDLERKFLHSIKSDVTLFYLDVSYDKMQERFKNRPDEDCPLELTVATERNLFVKALDKSKIKNKFIIDANKSPEQVYFNITENL